MEPVLKENDLPHLSVLQKRKSLLENDAVMLTRYYKKLNVGSEFIFSGHGQETVLKFGVKIYYLIDSEAEVACLSQCMVWDEQFPAEERKMSEQLFGFTGRSQAGTGEAWDEKTQFLKMGFEYQFLTLKSQI